MKRVLDGVNASWDGSELDLSMSKAGLDALIDIFGSNLSGIFKIEGSIETDNVSMLEVVRSDGKITLHVADQCANFSGGNSAFELLVKNMKILSDAWRSGRTGHMHFDPASDSSLLEDKSDALILSFGHTKNGVRLTS